MGLTLALALTAGLGIASLAAADSTCPSGCGSEKVACLTASRQAKLACKQDCRDNAAPSDLGSCMHGCRDTSMAAVTECRSDHRTCVTACSPPTNASCNGDCGQALGGCAQSVVATAQACIGACPKGNDRLACLQGCAAGAQSGKDQCSSDADACRAACSASPSGAFLDGSLAY
jgi:hypothetical protein